MQVQSLGRYRIEKELGSGAMGRVFAAYDPNIDRRVAIKTVNIFSSLPESERAASRERFLREARSAGKLSHPGIVTIYDVGDMDGVPYMAMELVAGESLDHFCKDGSLLPVSEVVALLGAAAEALGFAHERGIVHRDVKPANLMRTTSSTVKVMDFGIAKGAAATLTHDGALFGTPSYMSPEQVRGDALDARSDLFSLAVVLYEMLTGQKPFGGDSVSSVLYRIVHEPPIQIADRADRIPPALLSFLDRALDKRPERRFGTGTEFASALRASLRPHPGPPQAVPKPEPAPERAIEPPRVESAPVPVAKAGKGSLWGWIAGSSLVIAAALAALRWFGSPGAPSAAPVLEARVKTEPAGIPVQWNGRPLSGDRVQFPKEGPFGVLSATSGCREVRHRLDPADAGTDVVLVLDPTTAQVTVDPGVGGAELTINGVRAGAVPASVDLDLCRENVLALGAPGFQTAAVTIAAKATPLSARTAVSGLRLAQLPTGRIVIPAARMPLRYFVDGREVTRSEAGLEVPQGAHTLRAVSEETFIDVSASLDVPAGGTAKAELPLPAIAHLTVQSFPPDCEVELKKFGSSWRRVGESPLRIDVSAGRYALRVRSPAGGGTREQDVALSPGDNPPVRVSFGSSGR